MYTWYEIMSRTPIRDDLPSRHFGESRSPRVGGGNVVRSKTTQGEGLVPRWGRVGSGRIGYSYSLYQAASHVFPILACRHQPAPSAQFGATRTTIDPPSGDSRIALGWG